MEIRYRPTVKDLTAFQRYVLQHQHRGRRSWGRRLLSWGFFVLVLALALVFVEELWKLNLQNLLLNGILVLIPVVILFVAWQYLFLRRVARSLPGETTVRIDEEGLLSDDGRVQALARWSGIEQIGQTKDHIVVVFGYAQGFAIPRAAFPDGGDPALQLMQRYCPQQEIEPAAVAVDKARKRLHRLAVAGGALAALLILLHVSPWRSSLELPDGLGSVEYMVKATGDADPEATLPLILDLHPLGGFPEIGLVNNRKRAFPARVVHPAAEQWHLIGHSWFSFEEEMSSDARREAARLAAFVQIIMERYPTAGRPIVTGFSQGGSMAFQLAVFYPELFVAAVPVAGALPDELPERSEAPEIVVRALHGADDEIVPADWARWTVDHMKEHGWDAELRLFPGVTHRVPKDLADAWRALLAELAAEQARKPQLGAR